ncbi:MAG: PSD1 and planctomycete cytochrome C domain-containing protein [Pirellulales bacterium]
MRPVNSICSFLNGDFQWALLFAVYFWFSPHPTPQARQAEVTSGGNTSTQTSEIEYSRDIVPIFEKYCIDCHGASKQKSDLRLDRRSAILKGSGSGRVVEVGNAKASRLIQVVSGEDSDYVMPPDGERLSAAEVSKLKDWIEQGAKGPNDSAELEKKLPWSFSKVARSGIGGSKLAESNNLVPSSSSPADKSTSEIMAGAVDYFLLQKLRENQLEFSSPADRRTLIRRLFVTVLGCPPSPGEVQCFLDDSNVNAYERLVDRVLADSRYGERMARHWFDVIRFAESHGFETNRVRYNAWPFRDYVIQTFNQNCSPPCNRFISEQIVGDAAGVDAANGYLVAGTFDLVKSPDVNLTLMQRQDELADLINTTGTAFLGLTLGCARCHDHKFDPVTQTDFYSMQAVFAGVNFAERPLSQDNNVESIERLKLLQKEVAQYEAELKTLRSKAEQLSQSRTDDVSKLRPAVNSKLNEEQFEPIVANAVRFTILSSGGSQPCIDEWEVFTSDGQNIALASTGAVANASSVLPGYAIHKIEHLNDGQAGNDHSWISNETNAGVATIEFSEPKRIARMTWGRDRNERFRDRLATNYNIEALSDNQWRTIASSKDRRAVGQNDLQYLIALLEAEDQQRFKSAEQKKKQIDEEIKKLTSGNTAWIGSFSQPGTVHRLYRGDPLIKREVVSPAMVVSLGGHALASDLPEQQRRRALADWLTAEDNPLTARVMVNRIWQFTFGTGIVDTPSDFGGNGSLPTHPELLDWLASDFVQHDWSVKQIHRQLLVSRAFQQSSKPTDAGIRKDSEARLLWRFPPRRLEAEAIRDGMLVTSGVMDWRMGGPGFFLQVVEQDNVYRYFPKEKFGPDEFRRMVYLTRIRGEQDIVFGSFDCPNGNQVIPKRSRSNTPLQALNLFNSGFVLQQAELLAERLRRETNDLATYEASTKQEAESDQVERQITLAFELMVQRPPDKFEVAESRKLIDDEGLEAFCRAMLNSTEFLFVF